MIRKLWHLSKNLFYFVATQPPETVQKYFKWGAVPPGDFAFETW